MLPILHIVPTSIDPSIHFSAGEFWTSLISQTPFKALKIQTCKTCYLSSTFQGAPSILKNSITIIILPQVLVTVPSLEETCFFLKEANARRFPMYKKVARSVKGTPTCSLSFIFKDKVPGTPISNISLLFFVSVCIHIMLISLKLLRLRCIHHVLLPLNTSVYISLEKDILFHKYNTVVILIKFKCDITYFPSLSSIFFFSWTTNTLSVTVFLPIKNPV